MHDKQDIHCRYHMESVMEKKGQAFYHKLYGPKKTRATYNRGDFIDYVLMMIATAGVVVLAYGWGSPIATAGLALCAFTLAMFVKRHGVELKIPVILKRPQELFFMFLYKFQNMRSMYFITLALLVLENILIAATPNLPHHVELMRTIAYWLFYIHLISITVFRTVILFDHLAKRELVREVLMQTAWKKVVNERTSVVLEILHAYFTGLLTHIVLIAPWYLVITYLNFSVIFLPVVCVINIVVHLKWMRLNNSWFYRDHWLGHNCEFEFVYLHGTHHDAIPCGLIGVAGNGFLEGFMRHTIGSPAPFYNPAVSFLVYMFDVKNDIELHQYIPGIYPRLSKNFMAVIQHSTHHHGRVEPYGFGMKLDQPGVSEEFKRAYDKFPDEITNSIKLDEELTGFEWDNPTHRKIRDLYEKYQN
jgi:hypothetical protein